MNHALKTFSLLSGLYLAQGLPYGFFTQAIPVFMREQGASLSAIGFASLLALPWALKFLWAPWVDRWTLFGKRRGFILLVQALSALALVATAFMDPGKNLNALLGMAFLLNLLSATQDIATDGLAVEILTPDQRGLGNGIQVAAYRIGMLLGGGGILVLSERVGFRPAFLLLAGLLWLAGSGVFWHRDAEDSSKGTALSDEESSNLNPQVIRSYLKVPGMLRWLIGLVLYKGFDAAASTMLRPYLKDIDYSNTDIGLLVGTFGFAAGLMGALLGGVLMKPLGRKRALLFFGIFQGLSILLYALCVLEPHDRSLMIGAITADHLAGGMATAALFTMMMDTCRRGHEGADYTLQASVVVAATGLSAAFSGVITDAIGYLWLFALSGVLCAIFSVVVSLFLPPPGLRGASSDT